MFLKKGNGNAIANAGDFDRRHGPWADLLVFHASRSDTPRSPWMSTTSCFEEPSVLRPWPQGLTAETPALPLYQKGGQG